MKKKEWVNSTEKEGKKVEEKLKENETVTRKEKNKYRKK